MESPTRISSSTRLIFKYYVPLLLLSVVLIVNVHQVNAQSRCPMEECSRHHHAAMLNPQMHRTRPQAGRRQMSQRSRSTKQNREYCTLLFNYQQCITPISKPCRGTLEYHTIVSLVKLWLQQHNCTGTTRTQQNVKSSRQQQETRRLRQQERQQERRVKKRNQNIQTPTISSGSTTLIASLTSIVCIVAGRALLSYV